MQAQKQTNPKFKFRVSKFVFFLVLVLCLFYSFLLFRLSFALIVSHNTLLTIMGLAIIVIPSLGVIFIIKDFLFVLFANRLVAKMLHFGVLAEDNLPKMPSGRPELQAADSDFERYKQQVEANPQDPFSWVNLALAYHAARDYSRARWAMRRGIALYRKKPRKPRKPRKHPKNGL